MSKQKNGFTLIEMIVTISVIGLVLPVLFAVIFMILQEETKLYRLSEVKKQGDYILNIMGTTVRNSAKEIYSDQTLTTPKCNLAGTSYKYPDGGFMYFKDKYDKWFRIYLDTNSNKTASQSQVIDAPTYNPVYLSTDKVRVEAFSITCLRTATYSPPILSIGFDICYNNSVSCAVGSSRAEENVLLHYQTNIKLRSY